MDFQAHLDHALRDVELALQRCSEAGTSFDGVLFGSGAQRYHEPRDRPVPFVPQPHFARLCPAAEPALFLRYLPGERPLLVRQVTRGYWDDAPAEWAKSWSSGFELIEVGGAAEARAELGPLARFAFIGEREIASALSLPDAAHNPERLCAELDWARSRKTAYEVDCIRRAAVRAADGHAAVARLSRQARSERALHAAYLAASDQLEHDTPYTNIIAWDAHSATLHYAAKRAELPEPGHVLLIDAGACHAGYASDITRTHVLPGVHPVFEALLAGMTRVQRELVAAVAPGVDFVALHRQAERSVCALLGELSVLRGDPESACAAGLCGFFFPHGLGHMLGLEVHDVAGHQAGPAGGRVSPPADLPYLRATRRLEPGHVVTIEPGVYFIPGKLEPLRASPLGARVDWALVDALAACGGIRIEDDVLVTDSGQEDLTHACVAAALERDAPQGPKPDAPGYR